MAAFPSAPSSCPDYETECIGGTIHVIAIDSGELGEPVDTVLNCTQVGQIDVVSECRDGVLWHVVFTDGVETGATDTGVPCDVAALQFEQVTVCVDGVVNVVTSSFDPATGTVTEISSVPTGEACGPQPFVDVEAECLNGVVHYVTFIDGAESGTVDTLSLIHI